MRAQRSSNEVVDMVIYFPQMWWTVILFKLCIKDHFAISSVEYLFKSTCGYAYTIIMRFTVMQEKTSLKTAWKELKHHTSKTSDNKENILCLIFKNIKSRHDLMIIYLKFKISTITCKKKIMLTLQFYEDKIRFHPQTRNKRSCEAQ